MKEFKQLYSSMIFFRENFMKKWDLIPYGNINDPAIFLGLNEHSDVYAISQHKGPKLLIWSGGDMRPERLSFVSEFQKQTELYIWAYPGEFSDILTSYGIIHKTIHVPIKDYNMFTPNILGDKIYMYKGINGDRSEYFKWDETISIISDKYGSENIIFADHLPLDQLIENIYKKCFVYIKPNPKGGCTTMFELAHMGIRTIGHGHRNLSCFSEYTTTEELINLIDIERKYIGSIRHDVVTSIKQDLIGNEWLNLEFWNK